MQTPERAGWYDDPEDDQKLRYFDGVVWTKHTTPRSTRQSAPVQASQGQTVQGSSGAVGAPTDRPADRPGGWQSPNPQFPGTPQSGQWNTPQGQLQQQPPQQPGQYPGYPGQPQGQYPGQPGQQAPWNAGSHPAYATGPTTPDGQPLASYGRRLGAFLIDWFVQYLVSVLFGFVFLSRAISDYTAAVDTFVSQAENGQQPDFAALSDSLDIGALMAFLVVSIVVFVVYQGVFLSRFGATPGKLLLGISVRQRSHPGRLPLSVVVRRVGFAAVLFALQPVPVLGFVALVARLLDLAWPAWDDKKQALHDRVADTNVVSGKQQR